MTLRPSEYRDRLLDQVIARRMRGFVGNAAFARKTPEGVYVVPINMLTA